MKIAIEAQRIFRPNKHGMDFVALEVIRELQKLDTENEYYILTAPGEDHCLTPTSNFHIVEIKCPSYPLWEQFALPRAIRRIKPDLLHCTSNTAPVFCSVPLVLTLHDIIFLEKKAGKNKFVLPKYGTVLPSFGRTPDNKTLPEDHYRFKLRMQPDPVVPEFRGKPDYSHPQRLQSTLSATGNFPDTNSKIPAGRRIPFLSGKYRSEKKHAANIESIQPLSEKIGKTAAFADC